MVVRIDEVLKKFEDLMDGTNGRFAEGEMTIELEQDAKVISQRPYIYRLPNTL